MKSGFKKFILFLFIAGLITGFVLLSQYIFETNDAGYYQIKQAAITGNMSVRNESGTYFQMFGKITEYKVADTYYFSKDALDGGVGAESAPIEVRFAERSKADISGSIQFRLSTEISDQLKLHINFKTYDEMLQSLIRQIVPEAVKNTAAIMKAEEAYAGRKAEFTALAERQIKQGVFATEEVVEQRTDLDGNILSETIVKILYDETGEPIIIKNSPLKEYNIEIISFVIKDIDFGDKTEKFMEINSDAYNAGINAEKLAKKARLDAITAKEEGKVKIALARAEEEVSKTREIIRAEKEMEVARLNALKAVEEANADLAIKKASAEGIKLLVDAGLAPSEKAQIEKETAIGVAAELAKINLPEIMSFGSDSGVSDPIAAIGLNQMLDVIDKLTARSEVSE